MVGFYDREKEEQELGTILVNEPTLVYFIYGPINSGKTSLLVRVLDALPEDMVPFYINLRARDISNAGDFLNVLFDVDDERSAETERAFMKDIISMGLKMVERFAGIPIPGETFNQLFVEEDRGKDALKYLEKFFRGVATSGLRPVFVLDELQMIKEVSNTAGRPLIDKLFNFMVRMSKELHLCHCITATSDSLFMESVHGNARLHGRMRYFLVDDLDRERAFKVYEEFGFQDKDLVWGYIGGKIGDMTRLKVESNLGRSEGDALDQMLSEEISRLRWTLGKLKTKEPDSLSSRKTFLDAFVDNQDIFYDPEEMQDDVIFWVAQNVLFLEPVTGRIRPQGRLVGRAIEERVKYGTFLTN